MLPKANSEEAIGRERYAILSERFLGAKIDLDETYQWGIEELARVVAEQEAVANEILPGATIKEAIEHLDKDPKNKLHSTDELKGLDAETQRPGNRGPGKDPLRHRRADQEPRVHDCTHPVWSHLLHRTLR
jgi:uncharacterized protein (DUF885 family)